MIGPILQAATAAALLAGPAVLAADSSADATSLYAFSFRKVLGDDSKEMQDSDAVDVDRDIVELDLAMIEEDEATGDEDMMEEDQVMLAKDDAMLAADTDTLAMDIDEEVADAPGAAEEEDEEAAPAGAPEEAMDDDDGTAEEYEGLLREVDEEEAGIECPSVAEIVTETRSFRYLAELVQAADLASDLADGTAELTVLAPSNRAVERLGGDVTDALIAAPEDLKDILLCHVIPSVVMAAGLVDGDEIETLGGCKLTVKEKMTRRGMMFAFVAANGGTVGVIRVADIAVCNSVVHVINSVLIEGTGEDGGEMPMGDADMMIMPVDDDKPADGGMATERAAGEEIEDDMLSGSEMEDEGMPVDEEMEDDMPAGSEAEDEGMPVDGDMADDGEMEDDMPTGGEMEDADVPFAVMMSDEMPTAEAVPVVEDEPVAEPSDEPIDAGIDQEQADEAEEDEAAAAAAAAEQEAAEQEAAEQEAAEQEAAEKAAAEKAAQDAAAKEADEAAAEQAAAEKVEQEAAAAKEAADRTAQDAIETDEDLPVEDERWPVCVDEGCKIFGDLGGTRPAGVEVCEDGVVSFGEYAGGFDGYFSTNAGDGHEDDMAEAVAAMLDLPIKLGDKTSSTNERVNLFMKTLRDKADPLNMDYPEDRALADGGERMKNIRKVNAAAESMIVIEC